MGFFGKKETEIATAYEPVAEVKEEVPAKFVPAHKTTIGNGVEFTGDFFGADPIEVSGKLNGKVEAPSRFTITRDGQYKGTANIDKINILGEANGVINCREAVITATGKLNGRLEAEVFLTEPGCIIDGELKVNPAAKAEAASEPAPVLAEDDDIPVTEEDLFD